MKLKRYSDILEAISNIVPNGNQIKNALKIKESRKIIQTHIDFISDVFIRLSDLGYKILIRDMHLEEGRNIYYSSKPEWSNKNSIGFNIQIFPKNQMQMLTNRDLILGYFETIEDYFKFTEVTKIIFNQLSYDYNILHFNDDKNTKMMYVIIEPKKNI